MSWLTRCCGLAVWMAGVLGCASEYSSSTVAPADCSNSLKDGDETDVDCGGLDCHPCLEGEECAADRDCASGLECVEDVCRAGHCSDRSENDDETDVDCGGADCAACEDDEGCLLDRDCTSLHCLNGSCAVPTCSDGIKNQLEADVDCGDLTQTCPRCAGGKSCANDQDCESQRCIETICVAASCTDGIANGTETDIDCGGTCAGTCPAGAGCEVGDDCDSGVCAGRTCAAEDCADLTQNGEETDVDCGGSFCEPCVVGAACLRDTDCERGFCDTLVCRTPSCTDQIRNQGESDVDCGDAAQLCPRCVAGESCSSADGCESGVCAGAVCTPPSCDDRVKNQDEGDVDCGGACTVRCADGASCREMNDCASRVCDAGFCQVPSCTDGAQNGVETGVDCGADCAARCDLGQGCASDEDCIDNSCNAGLCADPSCANARLDGAETDIDCGGNCPPCPPDAACVLPEDCISGVCANRLCSAPTCEDAVTNGLESDTDCGGDCDPCADGEACGRNDDCLSRVCSGAECAEPSCTDGVRNDLETDADCGGPVCVEEGLACALNRHCLVDSDCQSEVCDATLAVCVAQSCSDTRKNQDETDVDCGGSCPGCDADRACETAADCADRICGEDGLCVLGTCEDEVANNNEGDVDCGGNCPERCQIGDSCRQGSDCEEGVCADESPFLCLAPTCEDGVKNGGEIGVDCAGTCAARCPAGQPCGDATDCLPDHSCNDYGLCEAPNCGDGLLGPDETDIDCGGPECGATCKVGETCLVDLDCVPVISNKCGATGVCLEAACGDQAKNGTETDVDCGGDEAYCAARCEPGAACATPSDCTSGVCTARLCVAPSCDDGVENGGESAEDCGAVCAAEGRLCPTGDACGSDEDCATGWCDDGTCAVRSCTDGIANGAEGDVDCGEICIGATASPLCAAGSSCGLDADCADGWCHPQTRLCVIPTCSDSALNQGETDVDCGGDHCARAEDCLVSTRAAACLACDAGADCEDDTDCVSLTCAGNTCSAADNCIGQLLSDTDGLLADGSTICASTNFPNGNLGCRSYLRCFFVNDCNPTEACFSSPTGPCHVNTVGGGAEPATAAYDTWVAAGCTSPTAPIP